MPAPAGLAEEEGTSTVQDARSRERSRCRRSRDDQIRSVRLQISRREKACLLDCCLLAFCLLACLLLAVRAVRAVRAVSAVSMMKRAVAQCPGGRQAEASTTAEPIQSWNVNCCRPPRRSVGLVGQYCTSQILDPFQGQGKGKGKGLPRGSRWRWLAGLAWPSRSFCSGGSFPQGRERYGNSHCHSHGHSHLSAQCAANNSYSRPQSPTRNPTASQDTLHFTG
jgi:hypothetical protein